MRRLRFSGQWDKGPSLNKRLACKKLETLRKTQRTHRRLGNSFRRYASPVADRARLFRDSSDTTGHHSCRATRGPLWNKPGGCPQASQHHRITGPGSGFGCFWTARRTWQLRGDGMAMIFATEPDLEPAAQLSTSGRRQSQRLRSQVAIDVRAAIEGVKK